MKTVRLRLTLAYDGARYQGWQTQKTGQGVQEVVEQALRRLFPGVGALHASSRTDTGVHALGLVAHVDVPVMEWRMPARKLVLALNAHLPEDIRIMSASRAPADFHARFQAIEKEYRYAIWNAAAMNPLVRHTAWHVPRPLDMRPMREAAKHLVGLHDFASFTTNPGYPRLSTIRKVTRCEIRRRGPEVTVILGGTGFLYRMCRSLVGTLVQVGLGRIVPDRVASILESRDRREGGMTAPAHGLVLWRVRYGKRQKAGRLAAATADCGLRDAERQR